MKALVILLLIASTELKGAITNDVPGFIGVRTEDGKGIRGIERVVPWSPADCAGIKVCDIILECDGVVGGPIAGPAYTTAHVRIRRGTKELTFDVTRIPKQEIKKRELQYWYDCGFECPAKKPAFEDTRTN